MAAPLQRSTQNTMAQDTWQGDPHIPGETPPLLCKLFTDMYDAIVKQVQCTIKRHPQPPRRIKLIRWATSLLQKYKLTATPTDKQGGYTLTTLDTLRTAHQKILLDAKQYTEMPWMNKDDPVTLHATRFTNICKRVCWYDKTGPSRRC